MSRHSFSYSKEFREMLRGRLVDVFNSLESQRFQQESQYTSAVLGKLHGIRLESRYGELIELESTAFDDRGRNSAESRYGADFAITATVGNDQKIIRKAILVQVKNKPIDSLSKSQVKELKNQIKKMKTIVASPKVIGIRRNQNGYGMFEVSSGNKILDDQSYSKVDFPSYFNQRVITTFDGTTDVSIVDALSDSSLQNLNIVIKPNNHKVVQLEE